MVQVHAACIYICRLLCVPSGLQLASRQRRDHTSLVPFAAEPIRHFPYGVISIVSLKRSIRFPGFATGSFGTVPLRRVHPLGMSGRPRARVKAEARLKKVISVSTPLD